MRTALRVILRDLNQLWIRPTLRGMDAEGSELARLTAFVLDTSGTDLQDLSLRVRSLRGGQVSPSVREVFARYRDEFGKMRVFRFVAKQVSGSLAREASIYEALSRTGLRRVVPSFLGIERTRGRPTHLYLEAVARDVPWPWKNRALVVRLLDRLAYVHAPDHARALKPHVTDWDYDAELQDIARATLEIAERTGFVTGRPNMLALRRMVQNVSQVRRHLLRLRSLPGAVLHGDLHPGNVVVRWRAGEYEPVLIDWGRARYGSPLEDLSSFLESLRYWEPTVPKHEAFLGAYLRARGLPSQPSRELEDAYWFASATNCLSGALEYHLQAAVDRSLRPRARKESARAIEHCLRLIRRADRRWQA